MKNVNSDLAYDYIRKRILSGEYPPGHSLMTNVLSAEIGVSRTPVRDALRQLEAEGLVSIQARIGASVKAMNLNEFRDMCGMRLALESFAAGLAAQNRTEVDLQVIEYPLDQMRGITAQIIESNDEKSMLPDLMREDVRFHIAIMSAGKNELMKKEILRLHLINRIVAGQTPMPVEAGQGERERRARRQAVLACHEEIFEAIERKDPSAAKVTMEKHLQEMIDHHIRCMARAAGDLPSRELTEEELAYSAGL